MYDLTQAKDDFPWTRVGNSDIEPWRDADEGWFDHLPKGWGDVIHRGLETMDAILARDDATGRLHIAQAKEKFGTLRLYVDVTDEQGLPIHGIDQPWVAELMDAIYEMEAATSRVCCNCGTSEHLRWRRGRVHLSCDECEGGARG